MSKDEAPGKACGDLWSQLVILKVVPITVSVAGGRGLTGNKR